LAIAAFLVIGIAVGRRSVDRLSSPDEPVVAAAERPAGVDADRPRPVDVPREGGGGREAEVTGEGAGDVARLALAPPPDIEPGRTDPPRLADPDTRRLADTETTRLAGGDRSVEASPRRSARSTAVRYATLDHFGRAEALLTSFRAGGGFEDAEVARWADDLLAQTRLLLDLSAEHDPALRPLLEELELVLAQIAGLRDGAPQGERGVIVEGMEHQGTLARLRAVVPAGAGT
ncbi:MAG: hypothetical protein ACRELC_02685, partial [Gemmatimonadota bacterium]